MILEHRRAEIVAQLLQANVTNLVAELARVVEENEQLRAKVAELEKKPAEASPAATPPTAP